MRTTHWTKSLLAAGAGLAVLATPTDAAATDGPVVIDGGAAPVVQKIRFQLQTIEVVHDGDAGAECGEADIRATIAGVDVPLRSKVNPTCTGDTYKWPAGAVQITLDRAPGDSVLATMTARELDHPGGFVTQYGNQTWTVPADGTAAHRVLQGHSYLISGSGDVERVEVAIRVRILNPVG